MKLYFEISLKIFILIFSFTMLSLILTGCSTSNTKSSLQEMERQDLEHANRTKEMERQLEKEAEDLLAEQTSKFPLLKSQNSVGNKIISHGSLIEVIEAGANANISYKSFKKLASDIMKEGKLRMWSQKKIASEIFSLPRGGLITIEISGYSIDSANSKYWEYIFLSMEDKELTRLNGTGKLPNYTKNTTSVNKWWNIDPIELNRDLGAFKVYVVDILSNRRSGFKIFPNKLKQ